jgi:hypothetical protein
MSPPPFSAVIVALMLIRWALPRRWASTDLSGIA